MKTKLERIIPEENIQAYLKIYHQIHEIDYTTPLDTVIKLNKQMHAVLEQAYQKKLITKEKMDTIWREWGLYKIDKVIIRKEVLREEFKGKKRRPPESDINFLLYALYVDLKTFTNKPQYNLIARFLREKTQERIFTPEQIRKRIDEIPSSTVLLDLQEYKRYISLLPDNIPENPQGFLKEICMLLDRIPREKPKGQNFRKIKLSNKNEKKTAPEHRFILPSKTGNKS